MKTRTITKSAIFLVLFFLASNIIPPITIMMVPYTFQTLIILLIPFFFNLKEIIFWYLTLLIMVLIGIPMMSGFNGGYAVLVGPTAGFIYGWLIQLLIVKTGLIKFTNKYLILGFMILSVIVNLFIGSLWLRFFFNLPLWNNLLVLLISFGPKGIIEVLLTQLILLKIPKQILAEQKMFIYKKKTTG